MSEMWWGYDEESGGYAMNERYEEVKKYMCKWQPEMALSACAGAMRGEEITDTVCLLCLARKMLSIAEDLQRTVIFLGVEDGRIASDMQKLFEQLMRTKVGLFTIIKKVAPEYMKGELEGYTDSMERLLQMTGVK